MAGPTQEQASQIRSGFSILQGRAGGWGPPPTPQTLHCPLEHHEAMLRVRENAKVTLGQPSETASVTSAGQRRFFSHHTIRRITV